MNHKRHRADPARTVTRCFSGPVGDRANPAAHGGICYVERCRCGAERKINVNGRHIERGRWYTPSEDA